MANSTKFDAWLSSRRTPSLCVRSEAAPTIQNIVEARPMRIYEFGAPSSTLHSAKNR